MALLLASTDVGCPACMTWCIHQATHLSDGRFHAVEVLKGKEAIALDALFVITRDLRQHGGNIKLTYDEMMKDGSPGGDGLAQTANGKETAAVPSPFPSPSCWLARNAK
jgi:hypothetical protein